MIASRTLFLRSSRAAVLAAPKTNLAGLKGPRLRAAKELETPLTDFSRAEKHLAAFVVASRVCFAGLAENKMAEALHDCLRTEVQRALSRAAKVNGTVGPVLKHYFRHLLFEHESGGANVAHVPEHALELGAHVVAALRKGECFLAIRRIAALDELVAADGLLLRRFLVGLRKLDPQALRRSAAASLPELSHD